MKFDNNVTDDQFSCDPQDQTKSCQLFFNVDEEDKGYTEKNGRYYVKNKCKCALDGTENKGYCSNVMGTMRYSRAVIALKRVMEHSNCHTLDRNDLYAQKDNTCGIGTKNDEWRFAVD
jgi:hypothetical protein